MQDLENEINELQAVLASFGIRILNLSKEIKYEKIRREADASVFKDFTEKYKDLKIIEPHIKVDEHFIRKQVEQAQHEFVIDMLAASAKFKEKTSLKIIVSYKVNDFITL